jgi:hypothetical protein
VRWRSGGKSVSCADRLPSSCSPFSSKSMRFVFTRRREIISVNFNSEKKKFLPMDCRVTCNYKGKKLVSFFLKHSINYYLLFLFLYFF